MKDNFPVLPGTRMSGKFMEKAALMLDLSFFCLLFLTLLCNNHKSSFSLWIYRVTWFYLLNSFFVIFVICHIPFVLILSWQTCKILLRQTIFFVGKRYFNVTACRRSASCRRHVDVWLAHDCLERLRAYKKSCIPDKGERGKNKSCGIDLRTPNKEVKQQECWGVFLPQMIFL